MLKVIFSDLDDTFLYDKIKQKNSMYTIPQRSLQALKEIEAANIKFVITTGRLYAEVVELLKRNSISTDLIVMDGCVAFEKDTHKLIDYQGISNQDTLSLMKLMKKNNLPYFICDDRNYYGMNYQWIWLEQAILDDDLEVTRIIVHGNDQIIQKALKVMLPWKNKFDIFCYPTNIVIQNKNTSKGKAIKRFIKKWNMDINEIAVFGDGINDDSMFALKSESVFIQHGKSTYGRENATIIAEDFYDGWCELKTKYDIK